MRLGYYEILTHCRWLPRKLREWVFGASHQYVIYAMFVHGCTHSDCLFPAVIEGGIFWCFGLLTFARFLGSFADLGWAWNRSPSGDHVSAEFTESFIIFLYGATNTWMERFGANPGDPFTTKQIQHISIAVSCLLRVCKAFLTRIFIRSCLLLLDLLAWASKINASANGLLTPLLLRQRRHQRCPKRQSRNP